MEEYTFPDRKRIPYGLMNFAVIRRMDRPVCEEVCL